MVNYRLKRDMLTTGDVARLLNVHVNTVRRWSNQEVIMSYRIGPRSDRRFRRKDVTRLLVGLNTNGGNVKKVGSIPGQVMGKSENAITQTVG
jgi:excisionase family DNA binding protein